MAFIEIASQLIKGVVKVGKKVGGVAVEAIKKGVAKRKEKKAAKKSVDPLAKAAQELTEGTSKYYRNLVSEQKDKMRDIDEKMKYAQKLINNGMSESEARAKVGLFDQDKKISVEAWIGAESEPEPEINYTGKVSAAAGKGCAWLTLLILSGGGALIGGIVFLTIYLF